MGNRKEDGINKVKQYIKSFIDEHNVSPTTYEISSGTGIPRTTVTRYLHELRECGTIKSNGNKHRNIVTADREPLGRSVRVPVLGSVSCGVPKFAEENIEEYVQLPVSLFGDGDFYLLRADGDSMINIGIEAGDLVLIRQQGFADEGQIVVALVEDEATLKRYYPEPQNRRVRLHPENDCLEDIFVDDCIIQGVAVKVVKDLR